jgi:hypothetical protein
MLQLKLAAAAAAGVGKLGLPGKHTLDTDATVVVTLLNM